MTNIILTGFMGTGKTTVGKLLAEHLHYAFVDTDALIEERAGMTVSEIFQTFGEPKFRQIESAISQELAGKDCLVISTGGRLMLDDNNREVLEKNGRIFCLTAPAEEIVRRVIKDGETRPLLAGDNPKGEIEKILNERNMKYAQFVQIQTFQKKPEQVVELIVNAMQSF